MLVFAACLTCWGYALRVQMAIDYMQTILRKEHKKCVRYTVKYESDDVFPTVLITRYNTKIH